MFGFFLLSIVFSSGIIPDSIVNFKIKNNLRDFSKNSDVSITNTVPAFLNQHGKFGCLQNNKIEYISTYILENKSICNADIKLNLDETAKTINSMAEYKLTPVEEVKKSILEKLYENNEKRYCFIHKDISCSSDKIVNYRLNSFYYLQTATYSLLSTYLFSLLVQIIYFKGFIYIIYGKKS